jgi:hypothetical protein
MIGNPAPTRRDRGITALVEGFFAAAWFGWGHAALMCVVAVTGPVAGLATSVAPGSVVGFGAGSLLLVSGATALGLGLANR